MRTSISFKVFPDYRHRMEAIVRDRDAPQRHVWQAHSICCTVKGGCTRTSMREIGTSKTCVWRWYERFAEEGLEGLLCDKAWPSRIPTLTQEVIDCVLALTFGRRPTGKGP